MYHHLHIYNIFSNVFDAHYHNVVNSTGTITIATFGGGTNVNVIK